MPGAPNVSNVQNVQNAPLKPAYLGRLRAGVSGTRVDIGLASGLSAGEVLHTGEASSPANLSVIRTQRIGCAGRAGRAQCIERAERAERPAEARVFRAFAGRRL